jgi:hypothetical protein
MKRLFWTLTVLLCGISSAADPLPRKHSNMQRLSLDRLAAVHADVEQLKQQRVAIPALHGISDYRCILHAHAEDSTHTGGTLPEMLADAKKAKVHAILLSDHFRPPRDFIDGRWRGLKEGVLFIPGSESNGFLIYPMQSILNRMDLKGLDFVNTVNAGDGLIFLSHLEERPKHSVEGLTGLEIYNRHWDAKRDKASLLGLVMKLTDPKQLAELEKALKLYPDELLAFQCDYPDLYLKKWDEGTKQKRLTGVAANDCHHNQIYILKLLDSETVLLGTNVDKDDAMRKVPLASFAGLKQMAQGRKPGDELARLDFDPYERSFRNSCTHVLAPKLEELSIRTALKAGHAYVSHDWMADPTGFRFEAVDSQGRELGMMGDELKLGDGLKLSAKLTQAGLVRLLRHGQEVAKSEGKASFEYDVKEAGAYRLEAWLKLDGEWRPWIYANPIYVK